MKFLVLLLTYIVQRKLNLTLSRQHDHWAQQFLSVCEQRMPAIRRSAVLYFMVALVLPALLLELILVLVEGVFFNVLTLFVHLMTLFFCLGCGYLKKAIEVYLVQWRQQRYQSAFMTLEEGDIRVENAENLTPAELHYQACHQYLILTFQRYFMVIFWYMIIGPVGALVVRLSYVSAYEPSVYVPKQVGAVYHVLEWIPARLLALSFALVGNFSHAFRQGVNEMIDPAAPAQRVLQHTAAGAVEQLSATMPHGPAQPEQDIRQMLALRDLLNRSMGVWFITLAVLTIGGWAS